MRRAWGTLARFDADTRVQLVGPQLMAQAHIVPDAKVRSHFAAGLDLGYAHSGGPSSIDGEPAQPRLRPTRAVQVLL